MASVRSEFEKYENSPRKRSTIIVLSQPRCGSTLLMRLVNLACMTHVVGDHDIGFYESLVGVYNSFGSGGPTYKSIPECEREGIFSATYRGIGMKQDRRLSSYYIMCMLTRTCGPSFAKTGIIGFNNNLTEKFVEMLREIESSNPIKIVFLTRNHADIVKSFQTREGPGQQVAKDNPDQLLELLDNQLKQFKSCYELGDIMLRYEDLIKDPHKWLLRMQPRHYPRPEIIEEVMSRKIR